ncbi:hypothetical protein C2G38_2251453 [Gigaspora rosea]|uniref:Uncharacterized protein n=1 Tax=Gigaspora rosea TaxID=44941 RepID=A0A397UJD3_9GLOM|nr:hypothetical protein C2G38_2251453 [Gigaspora rosea]
MSLKINHDIKYKPHQKPPCISQITAFARLLLIIPKDENLISKDAAPLVNVLNKEEYPSIVDNGTCACLTFFGLTILSLLDEKNIGSSGTYISILLSKLSNKFLDVSSLKTFLQRFPVKSPKYSPGTSMFTFIKGSSNTRYQPFSASVKACEAHVLIAVLVDSAPNKHNEKHSHYMTFCVCLDYANK